MPDPTSQRPQILTPSEDTNKVTGHDNGYHALGPPMTINETIKGNTSSDPVMGSKEDRRRAQFELLRTLLHRELRGRYRDSILGSAWTLLQPIAMTAVYYVLFSFLFPNNQIPNFPVFILTGIILWNFYVGVITYSGPTVDILDSSEQCNSGLRIIRL